MIAIFKNVKAMVHICFQKIEEADKEIDFSGTSEKKNPNDKSHLTIEPTIQRWLTSSMAFK